MMKLSFEATRSVLEPWNATGVERVARALMGEAARDPGALACAFGSDSRLRDIGGLDLAGLRESSWRLRWALRCSKGRLSAKSLAAGAGAPELVGRALAFPFWLLQKLFERAHRQEVLAAIDSGCPLVDEADSFLVACDFLPDALALRALSRPFGAAIVYDMIPLLNPEFCPEPRWRSAAVACLESHAKNASACLCISDFTMGQLGVLNPSGRLGSFQLGFDFGSARRSAVAGGVDGGGRLYALAVGSIEPRKNIGRLLEGYAIHKRRAPSSRLELVLAGRESWGGADVLAQARRLAEEGLPVSHAGSPSDDELARLYAGCRGLFFPSLVEGFGLPLVEALSKGKRVYCSAIPAFEEIVEKGGAVGTDFFDPADPESIADAFDRCLSTPGEGGSVEWVDWSGSYGQAKAFLERSLQEVRP